MAPHESQNSNTEAAQDRDTATTQPPESSRSSSGSQLHGFKPWQTQTDLSNGKPLLTLSSYDENTKQFTHNVNVRHDDLFTLKPVIITEGPLKGRKALLLEDATPFRFTDLPPEIRQMIYRILLKEPEPIKLRDNKHGCMPKLVVSTFRDQTFHPDPEWDKQAGRWKNRKPHSSLAIMNVNKLLFQEGAAVMYGENHFHLADFHRLRTFLESIGVVRRQLRFVSLRRISGSDTVARRALHPLKDAKGLRKLTFHAAKFGIDDGPAQAAADLLDHCRPLIKALQKAQKTVEVPVNVLDVITVARQEVPCGPCTREHFKACCHYGRTCAIVDSHCLKLNAKFRELVGKELGISQ